MKNCINCNAEMVESALFCPKCGHDQRVDPAGDAQTPAQVATDIAQQPQLRVRKSNSLWSKLIKLMYNKCLLTRLSKERIQLLNKHNPRSWQPLVNVILAG